MIRPNKTVINSTLSGWLNLIIMCAEFSVVIQLKILWPTTRKHTDHQSFIILYIGLKIADINLVSLFINLQVEFHPNII